MPIEAILKMQGDFSFIIAATVSVLVLLVKGQLQPYMAFCQP